MRWNDGGKSSNETISVGSLALTPLGLYGMDVEEGTLSEGDGIFKTSEHPPPVQVNQGFDIVSCPAGMDISAHVGGGSESPHWDWAVKA